VGFEAMTSLGAGVEVQMRVGLPVVIVRVGMEGQAQGAPEAQEPDRDEQHAHESLAPGLDEAQVEPLLEGHGERADHEHPQAVSDAPARAQDPGPASLSDRKGKERGQVIGPGHHVHRACEQAGSEDEQESGEHGAKPPKLGRTG
jgi:hypothetical protein